jgi:hypothetical protein
VAESGTADPSLAVMRSFFSLRVAGRVAGALAVALLLAGCGIFGSGSGSQNVVVPSCPTVAVLPDAAALAKYRSPRGRDLTDVVVDARVVAAHGECTFNRHDVTMALTVGFDFALGPANRDRTVAVSYFVAIVDSQNNVVAREEMPIQLQVPVNQSRVTYQEELEPRIPFHDRADLVGYRIFVGLVLTPEEAANQRARTAPDRIAVPRPAR